MSLLLYQFELCPFCQKVRAGLNLRGIDYDRVEVNPMTKKEISHVPLDENGKKKVPVVELGEFTYRESSVILRWLDDLEGGPIRLNRDDPEAQARIDEIEEWIDEHFMRVLPTVLYGSWGRAIKAARLTAQSSNFSKFDNLKVSIFGSIIMRIIAQRTLKRMGQGQSAQALFEASLDHIEGLLKGPFLIDDKPSLADAALHGAFTCVRDFPAFDWAMQRESIGAWYARVDSYRAAGREKAIPAMLRDSVVAGRESLQSENLVAKDLT